MTEELTQFPPGLPPLGLNVFKQITNVAVESNYPAWDKKDLSKIAQEMVHTDAKIDNIGYFGNIWVRQLNLLKKGHYHQGHRHHYDHITLVAKGSVLCEIPDNEPKVFKSPTFITIRANDWHKFTALEDDTVYYCIYAIRNEEGKVTDGSDMPIFMERNSPYPFNQEQMPTDDEVRERLKKVEFGCGNCGCGNKINIQEGD